MGKDTGAGCRAAQSSPVPSSHPQGYVSEVSFSEWNKLISNHRRGSFGPFLLEKDRCRLLCRLLKAVDCILSSPQPEPWLWGGEGGGGGFFPGSPSLSSGTGAVCKAWSSQLWTPCCGFTFQALALRRGVKFAHGGIGVTKLTLIGYVALCLCQSK